MKIEQMQYVTIGDEYAKRLGYEDLVGSMAVVDSVLKALVGVMVVSGNQAMIGKQVDIHKADALLVQNEAPEKLYAVADFIKGIVYYSKNEDFVRKCARYIGMNQTQVFDNFHYVHELLDELHRRYMFKRAPNEHGYIRETVEKMNWMAYPLDDETCEVTKAFRDTYASQMMSAEERVKKNIEIEAESKKKVKSLTDSFKSQLTSHIEGPGVVIHWNPDDAAADYLDSHSDNSEPFGDTYHSDDDGLTPC